MSNNTPKQRPSKSAIFFGRAFDKPADIASIATRKQYKEGDEISAKDNARRALGSMAVTRMALPASLTR